MDGTSDAHTGWEHIPPALAAVARRSGITAAELDAFRDDPANQDTGLPEFDDVDWDRILAPAPDDLPERAAVDRSPRVHLPATEPIAEPSADDRRVALARLDALRMRGGRADADRPSRTAAPTIQGPQDTLPGEGLVGEGLVGDDCVRAARADRGAPDDLLDNDDPLATAVCPARARGARRALSIRRCAGPRPLSNDHSERRCARADVRCLARGQRTASTKDSAADHRGAVGLLRLIPGSTPRGSGVSVVPTCSRSM